MVTLGGGTLPAAKRRLWALHIESGMCGKSRDRFLLVITHPPTLGGSLGLRGFVAVRYSLVLH